MKSRLKMKPKELYR